MVTEPTHNSPPSTPTTTRNIAKPRSNRNQQRRTSNNTTSPEKRNKANKACKGCRKKKVKCEGEVPCERCQKAGLDCVFDTVASTKRTSSTRRHTNKNISSQTPTRSNSQDEIDTSSTSTTAIPLTNKGSQQQQNDEGEKEFFTSIPAPADGISVSTTGRGLYIPDWLSKGGIENNNNHSPDDGRNNNMFAKPSDIRNDLLSTYFDHVHPYLPIIHRPTFQKQLQENKICELLLYAMYAVASRWNNINNQKNNTSSNPSHSNISSNINNHIEPIGWTYYESAFKLLDHYADAPRLSTVQALILMIKYHEHVRRPGFFWRTRFYFQLIVRMCQDLELDRHQHDQSQTTETEQRSRLFWVVYAYDALTSTEQGTLMNFTNCSIDFPQQLPEEDGRERDIITYFHWSAKIAHIHGKILTFLRSKYGQGSEEFYDGSSNNSDYDDNNNNKHVGTKRPIFSTTMSRTTLSITQERKQRDHLAHSIEELGKAMFAAVGQPQSCTDDRSFSTKQYPYYASRFLYMSLHFTSILLHRPYGETSLNHRDQCSTAALAITQIANELVQTGSVECLYYCPRGVQQVIHYLAASITIHRLLASAPPFLPSSTTKRSSQQQQQKNPAIMKKKAKEACDKSLEIIYQLIKVSPAVEIYEDRHQHSNNPTNNNSDEDEPATPPSPLPTPMEEIPILPTDRTAKARRVSKEFSGIRQNSSGGLISTKMETIQNNNAASMVVMPPLPQPQPQQNTSVTSKKNNNNNNTTPTVNSNSTSIQQQQQSRMSSQQNSPFPQSQNLNRFSAPHVMSDYASSLYLQQQQQQQQQQHQQQQSTSISQYPTFQQATQYGIPNFSQTPVSIGNHFYSQALVQQPQQSQQPFISQQQQQTNHYLTQQFNMYQQQQQQHNTHHQHSHNHHPHNHTHQQQNSSSRRPTVSGDITAMNNFMMYSGIASTSAPTAGIIGEIGTGGGDVTSSSSSLTTTTTVPITNSNENIIITSDNSHSGVINNASLWPTTTAYIDQDIRMDSYNTQPNVAQSMMGLLMDPDDNSVFAATVTAPAPP
ncbi:hypothetical protein INT45_012759 [Circinella minor]|uniref:Zn(2)-C6 fungal-type domain-containing protein n=1 Tax=Circinella minor TaxID=1195481 RepID=A0A8H7S741_9FUNG|nr:hypothetical protein INT45_012759 [Circinella minor]